MLSPREIKALKARYSPPKDKPVKWQVIDCRIAIFEHESAAICQSYIDKNQLKNAFKRPVYENSTPRN
jgi:hypothetical protein